MYIILHKLKHILQQMPWEVPRAISTLPRRNWYLSTKFIASFRVLVYIILVLVYIGKKFTLHVQT